MNVIERINKRNYIKLECNNILDKYFVIDESIVVYKKRRVKTPCEYRRIDLFGRLAYYTNWKLSPTLFIILNEVLVERGVKCINRSHSRYFVNITHIDNNAFNKGNK